MLTKGDVLTEAFSDLRISGLTSVPSPEEQASALIKLEGFMHYLEGRNVCLGYQFEDTPDTNTKHGVAAQFFLMMSSNTAMQLASTYGKTVPLELTSKAKGQLQAAVAYSAVNNLREVPYPNRQPLGNANALRMFSFQKFYPNITAIQVSCENIIISYSEINDYFEDFSSYLQNSETISSYTIASTDGVNVTTSSNADPRINFTLSTNNSAGENQLKFTITTSTGRVEVRQRTVIVKSDLIG